MNKMLLVLLALFLVVPALSDAGNGPRISGPILSYFFPSKNMNIENQYPLTKDSYTGR